MEYTNLKDNFYPSPLNNYSFKIACTIFRVIIFQDYAAATSLQNDTFDLQVTSPVLANGDHSELQNNSRTLTERHKHIKKF